MVECWVSLFIEPWKETQKKLNHDKEEYIWIWRVCV